MTRLRQGYSEGIREQAAWRTSDEQERSVPCLVHGETTWIIPVRTLIHAFGQQCGQQGERVPDTQTKCFGVTEAGGRRQRIEPRQNKRRAVLTNAILRRFPGGFFGWDRWHSARQCR